MNALIRQEPNFDRDSRALTAADVREHVNLVQSVMKAVMVKDTHYGVIPGCKQPSLYKAGSEVLLATFRIAVKPIVEDLSTADCVRYRVHAVGTHQGTGIVVGEGVGECSSNETKYKWRRCYVRQEFDATPETHRRIVYRQPQGSSKVYENMEVRVDPADVANTILKMAKKRAQIDLTLTATAASDIFTQDVEDMPEELREHSDEPQRPGQAAVAKTEDNSPERAGLIEQLERAALGGEAKLLEAWKAMTEPQRTLVGLEFGRIKKMAPTNG